MSKNRKNLLITIFSVLVLACMNICLAYVIRLFIEGVEQSDTGKFSVGIRLVAVYCVVFMTFSKLRKKYTVRYYRTARSQFKGYVLERLLSKSVFQVESDMSSKFLSAFSNDINSIEANYLGGRISITYTLVMFFAAGVTLIWTYPSYGISIVAVGLVSVIYISKRYGSKLAKGETRTAEESMGFVSQVKDILSGFMVIKSFKAEKDILTLFKDKDNSLEHAKQVRSETANDIKIASDTISILIHVLLYAQGFILAANGKMTIGMVISAIQLGNYIIQPVYTLGRDITNYKAARALIERLDDALEDEVTEGAEKTVGRLNDSIRLENLSFSYGEKPVLHDISLTFEKGKSYAIVGGSGSGKTTLINLLLGYMPGYTGHILYDGTELRDTRLDSLYDQISVIQQDVFLFDSSIKNNITLFHEFDEAKLGYAIEHSSLAAFISQNGLDYGCGEGGKNLSGGEKQRVAIARSLLRETPVLLVDEATAALDAETAFDVAGAILDLPGLTRIVVTHSLNEELLRRYDSIIALKDGHVAESGSFDELMDMKGYFYSFYTVSK